MKRCIVGAGLLIVLLSGGILSSAWLGRSLEALPPMLEQAAEAAEEGGWNRASQLADRAEQRWQELWKITAVFVDHTPMEQIDALFAQLTVCEEGQFRPDFGRLCVRLARELEALSETHSPTWWNLL